MPFTLDIEGESVGLLETGRELGSRSSPTLPSDILGLADGLKETSKEHNTTAGQFFLASASAREEDFIPIPGPGSWYVQC
jgi:hypothetical protein